MTTLNMAMTSCSSKYVNIIIKHRASAAALNNSDFLLALQENPIGEEGETDSTGKKGGESQRQHEVLGRWMGLHKN